MLKTIIENYSKTLWNSKDKKVVDELFTDESILHSPLATLKGKEAMKEIIDAWMVAFPDLVVDHEAFVEEGDTVVSRWKASGTHKGPFKGIEPTGSSISYEGVSIYQFSGGKVSGYWAFVNMQHLTDQLKIKASSSESTV